MRAIIVTAVLMVASAGAAVAQTVSVTLASCTRRDALRAAEYQSFWRYLALGDGYKEWRDKRVIFALYVGTPDRSAYLECFEALDGAVERTGQELGRTPVPGKAVP